MDQEQLLRETYRLAQQNNKMLHKIRRNAFWGGIIRIFVYAALLAAPLWFYMSYLAPVVDKMFATVQQIQGTSAEAQAQFSGLQETWKQIQSKFPSFGGGTTTSQ